MDYLTSLREAHAKLQREREETACEIGQLIDEFCRVLQKFETVLSNPQIAILVARQEALIEGEEGSPSLADDVPGLRRQSPPAAVYVVPDIDPIPDPACDEHDGLDI